MSGARHRSALDAVPTGGAGAARHRAAMRLIRSGPVVDCDPATGSAAVISRAPCPFSDQQADQATTVTCPL
ncbi:hypothetical protein LK07_14135 [Streptomyces pluripotens]|uniref:Uncharacterized protein n=1 Tax=Streptomyces pluripotens TaxID=1355015 RepID=A0A221NY88_9ACTN|nr:MULTISPECIES: hypothetical protein [Streptomyces]ARP70732.1 hypothetical protein LK06_013005 [Streptomyces pluripotens]ASN24993.1 hypothetical protein LK07_14135 [Streptomyces pluripotens]MCH0556564.1 hypothetical protein [Streptomyces sp. MUM 16J]